MPVQKEHNALLGTIVTGFTTILWGRAVLELTTKGGIHSPDLLADAYLFVMASYAGAGEIEKWRYKAAWNPENDPWPERAQRAGIFLVLWSLPFAATILWRLHDNTVPFPVELKVIWTGLFGIFVGKNASRSIRHTEKGLYGTFPGIRSDTGAPTLSDEILTYLAALPRKQASPSALVAQFPQASERHIRRLLSELTARKLLDRKQNPDTQEVTYQLRTPTPAGS